LITCRNCGRTVADGTHFCTGCGRPLADVSPTDTFQPTGEVTRPLDENPSRGFTDPQFDRTVHFQTQQHFAPTELVRENPVVTQPQRSSTGRIIIIIAAVSLVILLAIGGTVAWIVFRPEEPKKEQPAVVVVTPPSPPSIPNVEPDNAPLPTVIPQAPAGKLEIAEQKIIQGVVLSETDLAGLSRDELRILRNCVYARHGRKFVSPELQRYFDRRPWYRPRSDYKDIDLTENDKINLSLILKKEQ